VIPDFDAATGNLPAGQHPTASQEMERRYGQTPWHLADALKLHVREVFTLEEI
jgi:hypothetical protein